jgi:hypothetical protein
MRRTARRIERPSVEERKAKARANRDTERVVAVKNLLSQHAEMKASGRMELSELEWVLFKLGCSRTEGEKLIALAKEAASV